MIALEPLYDFLSLVLWTGAVVGERPASCVLIAPPGAGKTSVLEAMQCDAAPMVSDLTSRDLSRVLTEHKKATHILLGDMMSLFGHKTSVVSLTCRMLSSLTGESLLTDSFTGESGHGRQLGMISAIPPEDFATRKVQSHFTAGGFATRFITVQYDYSPTTKARIHDFIMRDLYVSDRGYRFPGVSPEKHAVEIGEDLARDIHSLAQVCKTDDLGTRIHRHLRALTKARARRDGRLAAMNEDVQAISAYVDFFTGHGKTI